VSDFDDIVNGAFNTAAQTHLGKIAAGLMRSAYGLAQAPGEAMRPITPTTPGMMSEEDAFRQRTADERLQNRAHQGAMNLLGIGANFAQPGALGIAGGKGGFAPEHHATALTDISSGKELLSGIKNALGIGEKSAGAGENLLAGKSEEAPVDLPPTPYGTSVGKFEADATERDPHGDWPDYDAQHDRFVKEGGQLPLTLWEKEAVGYWSTPEGYKEINGALRGKASPAETMEHVARLDDAIGAQRLNAPMTAYRGVYGPQKKILDDLNEGDSFHNAGYVATTLDPRRATHYGGKNDPGAILAFHLPEGASGLYTSHPDAGAWSEAEREMLLPHGQQYKITHVENIGAPRWHYSGDVTNPELQNYNIYHVEPTSGESSRQMDLMPGAKDVPAKGGGPSLSEKSVQQALEENPGASIADIAGLGPSEPKPIMSAEDKYKGYSAMKDVGDEKFNIYDPGGSNVGYIKKMEEGEEGYHAKYPWALSLHADEEGMAGVTHSSISNALEEAAHAHPKLSSVTEAARGMEEHIKPFDWNALRGEKGVNLPEHALEQGYNALYPLYKGTKDVFDYPEKLGTTLLSGKKQWEKGLFFADDPKVGKGYAEGRGNVLTYVARAEKPMQVDWGKATGQPDYDTTSMHHLIEAARAKGADLLHIRNVEDVGKYDAPQNQIVALNPNIIRAPSANFDPARMRENVVKAGIAAAGATPLFFNKDGSLLIHLGDRGQEEKDDKK
jgi:ADP-ribosyltransferase exoenzyme